MSKRTRRRHTAEQKTEALKRHHLQKEDVSAICEDLKLNPSVFYQWQRTLFANAGTALEGPAAAPGAKTSRERELEKKIAALEEKLAKKDGVIAEISAEYVELKKELGEP
jgi:transposase-like protein